MMKSMLPILTEAGILLFCLTVLVIFLPCIKNPVRNAPAIPSPKKHRVWACMQISQLGPLQTVIEVGAGWGGLACDIARLPNVKNLIAIEMSPILAAICRARLPRTSTVICTDVTSKQGAKTIKAADAIVIYGFKEMNEKLLESIQPGTYVLSIIFPFPNLRLIASNKIGRSTSFLYQV